MKMTESVQTCCLGGDQASTVPDDRQCRLASAQGTALRPSFAESGKTLPIQQIPAKSAPNTIPYISTT
jgi:hypothetical protein